MLVPAGDPGDRTQVGQGVAIDLVVQRSAADSELASACPSLAQRDVDADRVAIEIGGTECIIALS